MNEILLVVRSFWFGVLRFLFWVGWLVWDWILLFLVRAWGFGFRVLWFSFGACQGRIVITKFAFFVLRFSLRIFLEGLIGSFCLEEVLGNLDFFILILAVFVLVRLYFLDGGRFRIGNFWELLPVFRCFGFFKRDLFCCFGVVLVKNSLFPFVD